MFRLDVFYDLQRDEKDNLTFRDDEIQETAGVPIVGSGGTRDCELRFATEEAMEAAKSELREAGFRFAALCNIDKSTGDG